MLHQYSAPRFRLRQLGGRVVRVGTIDVGTILYIQDDVRPLAGLRDHPVCRNPWIVECWHPRECMGKTLAGGHLATVRSLRDGRRQKVAYWILLRCDGLGLTQQG